jgi:hypothetical protein
MQKGAHAMKPKSENRLGAERLMKTPEYWRDRNPDLIERVNAMFRNEPGGSTPIPTTTFRGGKGVKLT